MKYRESGRSPVLQIETHGSQHGIGGDEGIGWPELMEAFIPRREYFFNNTFPENDARFDVTFEQCWPADMELRVD
ncbi:MAG TPA: hypothetical protein VKB50_13355 [Vicinamibacterales bacterium]|nr:hypothetical protein [Vicinamibacterales bacterium]